MRCHYICWLTEKLNTQLKCSIYYNQNMTLTEIFFLLRNKPVTGFCQSLVDLADVQGDFRGIYAWVNLIHIFTCSLKSQEI